jgi:hypothetical protein
MITKLRPNTGAGNSVAVTAPRNDVTCPASAADNKGVRGPVCQPVFSADLIGRATEAARDIGRGRGASGLSRVAPRPGRRPESGRWLASGVVSVIKTGEISCDGSRPCLCCWSRKAVLW